MSDINTIRIYFYFRIGISFKRIASERKTVTSNMTAPWNETALLTLLSSHELNEIFNTDEIDLFYQCLPNKTFHLSAEKYSGGKKVK